MSTYGAGQVKSCTVNYGVFNDQGVLLIYGDNRSEIISLSRGLKVGVMTKKNLSDELEKALAYYILRNS